ncbi:wall-associated receptor kinase-like 2 [Eucalyptus grandis]|uniref:wall-associated receptor kinase-like 2 n=1 Tax=Eucalyptus grandis TaxID=71139 RepID=UPI00192F056E|nr:wall-associated receptor kinase-like 2 [Eucalyptus grandis]
MVEGDQLCGIDGLGQALATTFVYFLMGLYKYIKKRKEIKLKRYFKCNGGLLLESELSSLEGNFEKSKLFDSKDLEKATDNFNTNQILRQDKSDVYSFGVVIVELLMGQKPISLLRAQEGRSLATYFIIVMEENRVFNIVDAHVLKEDKKEEIASVANLAERCLNLNGRKWPTMKEVAMESEGIRKRHNRSGIQQNQENREPSESYDAVYTSSKSSIDMDVIIFSDVQPILPNGTW